MSPKSKLSLEKIIETAIDIANEKGFKEVTLTAVAKTLHVRLPSLYNYIEGIEDLRNHVRLRGVELLTEHVEKETKEKTGEAALRGVATGYRKFARSYPGLYPQTLKLDKVKLPPISTAWDSFIEITSSVMISYGLDGHEPLHMMRTLGSMMHGFVELEREVGFERPANPDESYERMLDIFISGLYRHYGLGDDLSSPSSEV